MSKDHFPVNDKTIADVNKANARAYDAKTPLEKAKAYATYANSEHGTTGKGSSTTPAKSPTTKKSSGDHVRESSQEHGEQHDAAGFTGYVHSRHEGGHKLIEGAGKNGGQWAVVTKGKHAGTYNNKIDAMGHIEAESD